MLCACTYLCVYLTCPAMCSLPVEHLPHICKELLTLLVSPIPSGTSVVTSEPIYYIIIKESTTTDNHSSLGAGGERESSPDDVNMFPLTVVAFGVDVGSGEVLGLLWISPL